MAHISSDKFLKAHSRLDFHARLALIATLIMGYLILFLVDVYPLAYAPGVSLAVILGYIRFFDKQPPLFSVEVWTLLTLMLVGGSMILSFTGHLFFLDALNLIFLILPVIKLLTAKSERDYLQVYALAFGQILYGTIVNTDLSFGLVFFGYISCTMWGLVLLTFRVILRKHKNQSGLAKEIELAVFKRRFVSLFLFLPIIALLSTFLLFFIVPRPGSSLASFSFAMNKRQSGFSDHVNLGEVGEIKLDESIAMRIEVDGKEPARPIYWRGAVLDNFDGMTWQGNSFEPIAMYPDHSKVFIIGDWPDESLTHQTIYLADIQASYLFHAEFIAKIKLDVATINLHSTGSVTLKEENKYLQKYEVWSYQESPLDLPKIILDSYLQLPANLDPRVSKLAVDVLGDSKTKLEAALKLEDYLKHEFAYSLKAGLVPTADPLTTFLFKTKSGHCEYFATAMTIMLRTTGVHARLVTGYQEGEFNESEKYFVVRQSDAHAWVEAFINGKWLRFDPTPNAAWANYEADKLSTIRQYLDALTFRWQRYVISYSARDQILMLIKADESVRNFSTQKIKSWIRQHSKVILLSVLAILLLLLIFNRSKFGKFLSQIGFSKKEQHAASISFSELSKVLTKSGVLFEPHNTAKEYIKRAAVIHPLAKDELQAWLLIFERSRYQRRDVDIADLEKLLEITKQISKIIKE